MKYEPACLQKLSRKFNEHGDPCIFYNVYVILVFNYTVIQKSKYCIVQFFFDSQFFVTYQKNIYVPKKFSNKLTFYAYKNDAVLFYKFGDIT